MSIGCGWGRQPTSCTVRMWLRSMDLWNFSMSHRQYNYKWYVLIALTYGSTVFPIGLACTNPLSVSRTCIPPKEKWHVEGLHVMVHQTQLPAAPWQDFGRELDAVLGQLTIGLFCMTYFILLGIEMQQSSFIVQTWVHLSKLTVKDFGEAIESRDNLPTAKGQANHFLILPQSWPVNPRFFC